MKDNEKWINALRKRLDNTTEPTPVSGWERLEQELIPSVDKRIYPYRRWAVAAAAVVLVVASSLSLYFLNSPVAGEMRHALPVIAITPDVLPAPLLPDVQIAQVEPMKPFDTTTTTRKGSRMLAKGESKAIFAPSEALSERKEEVVVVSESVNVAEKEKKEEQAENKQEVRRPSSRNKLHLPEDMPSARKRGKWSMGVSVGNGGSTSSPGGDNFDYVSSQRVNLSSMANSAIAIPGDKELVFEDGVPYLQAPREIPKIEHRLPITFGLSVRKSLPKGFSVETGLNYTLLSSDVTMSGSSRKESRKLHYLGIPVRANWNFYDKKRFTLYVSGGGMVEKCVYGKLAGEKVDVKPLQLSVMGAVGAQFNASRHIGVYVEPGVSYFFNDGSNVQTIRKETPLNFNLQGGIRFTY